MNTHKRNRHTFGNFLAFLAALAAVGLLLWSQQHNADKEDTKTGDAYRVLPGSKLCYAANETLLAAASTGGWQLFDDTGREIAAEQSTLESPMCAVSKAVSIFYGVGDRLLQLAYPDGQTKTLETDGAIRFADVNRMGQLAVITDSDIYTGSVTVYSKQLTPLFRWEGGTDRPVCVRLSPKGQVAIGCLTETGSRLLIFRTDKAEPLYECNLTNERILDLSFLREDSVAVITDSTLFLWGKDTEHILQPRESFPALFDGSDKLAAMVSTAERFGGNGTLYTLSRKGNIQRDRIFSGDILDISVCDNRVLLLSGEELILCSRRLDTIASRPLTQEAEQIFLRPDNTALAVGANGVNLYDFGR